MTKVAEQIAEKIVDRLHKDQYIDWDVDIPHPGSATDIFDQVRNAMRDLMIGIIETELSKDGMHCMIISMELDNPDGPILNFQAPKGSGWGAGEYEIIHRRSLAEVNKDTKTVINNSGSEIDALTPVFYTGDVSGVPTVDSVKAICPNVQPGQDKCGGMDCVICYPKNDRAADSKRAIEHFQKCTEIEEKDIVGIKEPDTKDGN